MTEAPTDINETTDTLRGGEALRHARETMDSAIIAPDTDPQAWASGLRAALTELTNILKRHREVSDRPGGHLDTIASEQPRLVNQIEKSRSEHIPLIERAESLLATLEEQTTANQFDVEGVRKQASLLVDDVRQHLAAGRELVFETYERDEGGEG